VNNSLINCDELKSAVLGHKALSNRPQYHAQTAIEGEREEEED